MEPVAIEKERLLQTLQSRHSFIFNDLLSQSFIFISYLKNLSEFKLVDPDPLLYIPHVGRVIIDGVLQVGHNYEKQVRKRVNIIIKYDEAATMSGFVSLLRKLGISRLLDWNSHAMEKDLFSISNFFLSKSIETYSDLKDWLVSEDNRDCLLTARSGIGGNSSFKIGDKTADYFCVLVCQWDAVAVDSNIKEILSDAGISKKYNYHEMRSIVQLSALEMNIRPIDLDASIYNYSSLSSVSNKTQKNKITKPFSDRTEKSKTTESITDLAGNMPTQGDNFKGKVNDLSLYDAEGWLRRDIWFFKYSVNNNKKFGYPTRFNTIILVDTDGKDYELNFSKPDLENKVCLGTPGRLKPWYKKKGFNDTRVNPDEIVYFVYTGNGREFLILTEAEYKSGIAERLLEG